MRIKVWLLIIMVSAMVAGGCSHVISKEVLKGVNRDISFDQLLKDPVSYKGQTVLLGGVVVKAAHDEAGTLLEVYQTDVDWEERPINEDASKGRFLAMYNGFLDSEIYKKGRKVTVAGIVNGVRTMKIGEIVYHYPLVLIREIHLWKKERKEPCDPFLWYPLGMWGPWGVWGPSGPWYYPYWRY